MKKYYDILEIKKYSSSKELNDATIGKLKDVAYADEQKALEILEAYVVLSNPDEKRKYDSISDEEYVFNPSNPKLKKPERVLLDAKSQVINLRYAHENEKKKYLGQIVGGFIAFVVLISLTIISIILNFGVWVVLFPATSMGGLFAGFKGIKDYVEAKQLDKRYKTDDVWDKVELM